MTLSVTLFENTLNRHNDVWAQVGIKPRRWQAEALPIAKTAIRERIPSIVQAVMGAGKSKFIAALVAEHLDQCDCIVVTTPRKTLVKQLYQTLQQHLPPGLVGRYFSSHKEPARRVIVVCDASTEKLAATLARLGRQVGLWVADECHGSEAERIHQWVAEAKPIARIGMTATPQRGKKDEALTLWDREIYRYDAGQALTDGVLVPFEIVHWHGNPTALLDDAMTEMIHQWHHVGPGIVDASSVEDAIAYSHRLREEGIRAAEIHSYMAESLVDTRLAELQEGNLDLLVHVSLLKEGVDLPWLRWMGLRRQVESRVYFAQHVGRVLRSDEGKTRAYILDPGDLFSKHKLNLEAILEVQAAAPVLTLVNTRSEGETKESEPEAKIAVSLDSDLSTLRQMCVLLSTRGDFTPAPAGAWRNDPITEKQLARIESFAVNNKAKLKRHDDVELFRRLYARRHELSKGQGSDLLSVFFAL